MYNWSLIQQSLPRPKSCLVNSFRRASADGNDSMLKLSSPCLRCRSIHVFVCWLNDWAYWKLCADWKWCHGFHCSEYLWCLLSNPVALPYALPPAFSTPTTGLWALIFVGSRIKVRSGFWWSIVSLSGVSSGGGAPRTLSMGRWFCWLTSSMAIEVHWLKWNHDSSDRSQPAGVKIPSGIWPSFIDIRWYYW